MDTIRTIVELEALYDAPVPTSITKEIDHLTDLHASYVNASPFVVIATSGPEGMDCSPRGDPPGFVRVADPCTLLIPIDAATTASTRCATSSWIRASGCSSWCPASASPCA